MTAKTFNVDKNTLRRLASNRSYNWMKSLAPLRAALITPKRRKGCSKCGGSGKQVPKATMDQVTNSATLLADLQQLKRRVGAEKMIVNVGAKRHVL